MSSDPAPWVFWCLAALFFVASWAANRRAAGPDRQSPFARFLLQARGPSHDPKTMTRAQLFESGAIYLVAGVWIVVMYFLIYMAVDSMNLSETAWMIGMGAGWVVFMLGATAIVSGFLLLMRGLVRRNGPPPS